MVLRSAEIIGNPTGRPTVKLSAGQIVENFHSEGSCFGDVCPVHRPSAHGMVDWPLAFTGVSMVRIVPGVRVSGDQGMTILEYSEEPVAVVIDPDDFGFLSSGTAILRNSGVCPHCGDAIVSIFRHHFSQCFCGKSFVDGGLAYLRRTADLIDTSLAFYAAVDRAALDAGEEDR